MRRAKCAGRAAIVPVSAAGLSLFASGGGHVVVDVTGYFTGPSAPPSSAGLFIPLDPTRLYDSRDDPNGVLTGRTTQRVPVPVNGAAMVGNWTMVGCVGVGLPVAACRRRHFTRADRGRQRRRW